jgi:hypothetical protein
MNESFVKETPRIAYFITYHGFGHATRAAAVMAALQRILPQARFELFTDCPAWIFKDTLGGRFNCHAVRTDVGMMQLSPFESDLQATCRALDAWVPFDPQLVERLCKQIEQLKCRIIVCDISPLGLAVAGNTGRPGILVENFTWDWIYAAYLRQAPALKRYIDYFKNIYRQADLHIQTEPLCRRVAGAVIVPPVGRGPRSSRGQVRDRLKIPANAKMVLVSMGGVPDRFDFLKRLPPRIDPFIVVPGAGERTNPHPKVIALPSNSSFYHPDLLQAADLLIGKAGYSTVAEAYRTGTPFGYVTRSESPESPVLEHFIRQSLSACPLSADTYHNGRWLDAMPDLLDMPRRPPPKERENGADVIAKLVRDMYFKG